MSHELRMKLVRQSLTVSPRIVASLDAACHSFISPPPLGNLHRLYIFSKTLRFPTLSSDPLLRAHFCPFALAVHIVSLLRFPQNALSFPLFLTRIYASSYTIPPIPIIITFRCTHPIPLFSSYLFTYTVKTFSFVREASNERAPFCGFSWNSSFIVWQLSVDIDARTLISRVAIVAISKGIKHPGNTLS